MVRSKLKTILPNVIIGGAPKCGTTSLYSWLKEHPDACSANTRAPCFLLDEDNPRLNPETNFAKDGLDGYGRFFDESCRDKAVIFEATTHYLYSKTAMEVLSSMEPVPKIVFMFRNPSDRIYSSFRFRKYRQARLNEDISFADYIDMVKASDMRRIEEVCDSEWAVHNTVKILERTRYADFVEQWLDVVPRDNLIFYRLRDLSDSPLDLMLDLSDRIGLAGAFYETFDFSRKKRNVSYTAQNFRLHRFVKKVAWKIPANPAKELIKDLYRRVHRRFSSSELSERDRSTLRELDEDFRHDNARLAELTGLDLSHWGARDSNE